MTPPPKQAAPGPEAWAPIIARALESPEAPLAGDLAAIVEAMEEGITVLDSRGALLFANRAGAALAGFDSPQAMVASPPEEAVARYQFFNADGAPLALEDTPGAQALRGERPPPTDMRYRLLPTGREIWVRVTATPFCDEQQNVRRVVLVTRDITAQRRAFEANRFLARASALLAESLDPQATLQALVRLAVPVLGDWCMLDLVDEHGQQRTVALASHDAEKEALAHQLRERYPPGPESGTGQVILTGQARMVRELPERALDHIAVDEDHLRLMKALGMQSLMIIPLRAQQGRTLGALTLVSSQGGRRFDEEDLALATELANRGAVALENAQLFQRLQRAEAKSREGEERLRLALEAGRLGTWEWDPRSGHMTFSPETERLHGLAPGTLAGHSTQLTRWADPQDIAQLRRAYEAVLEGPAGKTLHELYRVYEPGGKTRWIETQGLLTRDEAGQPLRLLGVCADVTEREEAAQARAAHAAELARSNTELQQFAYVASHDLQEPLRMVSSYAQLLARRFRGRLDADADEYIGFVVEGVSRMHRLISDLLTYSRVGSQAKAFAPVSCNDVLRRVLANLQEAIRESGATVTAAPLPEILGDDVQLEQLLQNLIGNAVKFCRPGASPEIRISAERQAGEWRFAVRDNGIGIEPQYFDRIFVIFQRLHSREQYAGTGIGLAICKKVVERHGGRIWVESSPGQGATFYFTLPAASSEGRAA